MNIDTFNQTAVPKQWNSICGSVRAGTINLAQLCQESFTGLLYEETDKFCDQNTPKDYIELSSRITQSMVLGSKISAICSASKMAYLYPDVAPEIVKSVKDFCDRVPLTDMSVALTEWMALSDHIRSICRK